MNEMIQEALLEAIDGIDQSRMFAEAEVLAALADVYTKDIAIRQETGGIFAFDGDKMYQEADAPAATATDSSVAAPAAAGTVKKGPVKTVLGWIWTAIKAIGSAFAWIGKKIAAGWKKLTGFFKKNDEPTVGQAAEAAAAGAEVVPTEEGAKKISELAGEPVKADEPVPPEVLAKAAKAAGEPAAASAATAAAAENENNPPETTDEVVLRKQYGPTEKTKRNAARARRSVEDMRRGVADVAAGKAQAVAVPAGYVNHLKIGKDIRCIQMRVNFDYQQLVAALDWVLSAVDTIESTCREIGDPAKFTHANHQTLSTLNATIQKFVKQAREAEAKVMNTNAANGANATVIIAGGPSAAHAGVMFDAFVPMEEALSTASAKLSRISNTVDTSAYGNMDPKEVEVLYPAVNEFKNGINSCQKCVTVITKRLMRVASMVDEVASAMGSQVKLPVE